MEAALQQLFSDPAKLTASLVLLAVVYGLLKGHIVPGYIYEAKMHECEEFKRLALRGTEMADRAIKVAESTTGKI